MFGSRSGLLAAISMAAVASASFGVVQSSTLNSPGLSQKAQWDIQKQSQNPLKPISNSMSGLIGSGIGANYGTRRRAGYGWTNKHQQRVSTKKRNQARHRAACRG